MRLFFAAVDEHFGFLVTEFGMRKGAKTQESLFGKRVYRGKYLNVEVTVDLRDRSVDVKFRPLESDAPEPLRLIGPNGSVATNFGLDTLLIAKGHGALAEPISERLNSNEHLTHMIERQARYLREHGTEVLRGDFTVFPSVAEVIESVRKANLARWSADKAGSDLH